MLLWTDCRAYLLAEGAGKTDRSPTVNAVRNSIMSVLEMSKLQFAPKAQKDHTLG